jgi:magnesium transporter
MHDRLMVGPPSVEELQAPDDALLRSAEQHASMRVPVASRSEGVTRLRERLSGQDYASAATVAVCEDSRLVGLVTIERVLSAPSGATVEQIMDADPPIVSPHTHQEQVAWAAAQRGEACIAVVDDDGIFRGLISAPALLTVLLTEHDEDLARLGGFLGSAAEARSASIESVGRRLLHRLPWLLLGLVGALFAAVVVGAFEMQLEEQVLIAFFVPGVVYIADAVGTQTETLVIRGLSLGVGIRSVAIREIVTGGLLGAILASLAFPLVWAGWGDVDVAIAVALAMIAASALATCIAMFLPWALLKLGRDPAFGAGPIATVVQDVLTVLIYFVTAAAIVT